MVHIVIAEDDPLYAAQLKQFLHDFSRESGQVFQITCYDNGEDLVEQYKPEYDLLLLDVEMPFLNGMQAAREIRRVDPRVIIIFITNLAQYAIQGYSVNALDYILKPLEYTSFSLHLSRALSYLRRQDDPHMSIAVRGGMVKLKVESIYYIESLERSSVCALPPMRRSVESAPHRTDLLFHEQFELYRSSHPLFQRHCV